MSNVIQLKQRPVKGRVPALIGRPQHYCGLCKGSTFHLVETGDILCATCNAWINNMHVLHRK